MKALERVKDDRKSQVELTVKSPFTRRIRESPLPRTYKGVGDLKFNGTTDLVSI